MKNPTPITYTEAKYLKHEGSVMDIKVTICTLNGEVKLNIGDFEYFEFRPALRHLQQLGEQRFLVNEPEKLLVA